MSVVNIEVAVGLYIDCHCWHDLPAGNSQLDLARSDLTP